MPEPASMNVPHTERPNHVPPLPENARCMTCGYALKGLPAEVCPECGSQFDSKNPATYYLGNRPPCWWNWAKPPPLWHLVPTVFYTLLCFEASTKPHFGLGPCLGVMLIPVILADYASRVLGVAIGKTKGFLPKTDRRPWRWMVTPICAALIALSLTILHPYLLRARFLLSKQSFERVAAACLAGNCSAGKVRIGWYWIDKISVEPPGSVFFMTGDSIADPVGFEFRSDHSGSNFGYSGWYEVEQ